MTNPVNGAVNNLLQEASQKIDRLDARLLLQFTANISHIDIITEPNRLLDPQQQKHFLALVGRRAKGEPLAYLVGTREFYGLNLRVNNNVLIPRPETELLVDLALHWLSQRQPQDETVILDLGTGSGAIAIAIAVMLNKKQQPKKIRIYGTDRSPAALGIAHENAHRHQCIIHFIASKWFDAIARRKQFDVIISNPPYVAAGDIHLSQNGLPFEPQIALTDGVMGSNGLGCIDHIIHHSPQYLKPSGLLMLEHGYNQGGQVRKLLNQAGFSQIRTEKDLAGIERVSLGIHLPK